MGPAEGKAGKTRCHTPPTTSMMVFLLKLECTATYVLGAAPKPLIVLAYFTGKGFGLLPLFRPSVVLRPPRSASPLCA